MSVGCGVCVGEGGSVSGIMPPHTLTPHKEIPLTQTWKKTPWEVLQPGL